MRFSTKAHYGLRAAVELTQAYHSRPLSLAEIAQAQNLSLGYLEQLMAKLRRAGLVKGTRGVKGGYRLSQDPSLISVGKVLRALEGPITPVECASENHTPPRCQRETSCPSRQVWEKVRDSLIEVFDSTTLADICHCQPAGRSPVVPSTLCPQQPSEVSPDLSLSRRSP